MPVYAKIQSLTATIANGATTSDVVTLDGGALCGIEMPASFTGTTLTIQGASTSGGTYRTLTLAGVANPITVAASGGYSIDPVLTLGWPYVKLVSGSTEGGARSITLLVRPV